MGESGFAEPLRRASDMHAMLPPASERALKVESLKLDSFVPNITGRLESPPVCVCLEKATFTVLSGENAGQEFPLDREEMIVGRAPDCGVWLHDKNVSREHARVIREPDGTFLIEDLQSRNGIFVQGRKVARAPLLAGNRVNIGTSIGLRFDLDEDVDRALQRALYEASRRDALTQAFNRAYLVERLARELATAHRTLDEVALLRLDIDDVARVRDVYGHDAIDAVMRATAEAVTSNVRDEDVVARWNGQSFAVLTRPVTMENAHWLADRIRRTIEARPIVFGNRTIRVTISIGVACFSEIRDAARAMRGGRAGSGPHLVSLADARALAAREAGRNRIVAP